MRLSNALASTTDRPAIARRQLEVAKRLLNSGAVSEEGHRRLSTTIKEGILTRPNQFLSFLGRTLVIDPDQLEEDPEEIYRTIYDWVTTSIPGFRPDQLTVRTTSDPDWKERKTAWVTFTANNQSYGGGGLTRVEPGKVPRDSKNPWRGGTEITHPINQWLLDRGMGERLFLEKQDTELTFVFLTEPQWKAIQSGTGDRFLTSVAFGTGISSVEKADYNQFFDSLELIAHLTQAELDTARRCRAKTWAVGASQLLSCYPRVLLTLDWESGNVDNPYEELTGLLATISRGLFHPSLILNRFRQDWDQETTTYGFTHHGKAYRRELTMNGDWLDPAFLELINTALADTGREERFHTIFGDDQVLLTPTQKEAIRLRIPGAFWWEEETED